MGWICSQLAFCTEPIMKDLFKKIEVSSSCDLGKKDKKTINRELQADVLKRNLDYKVHKCKNKTSIVSQGHSAMLFQFGKKYFPTIRLLERCGLHFGEVYLDDGAVGPLSRGADVMTPGIFKYREMIDRGFKKGDVVVIRIIGKSVFGVGEALLDLQDMSATQSGIGVEVHHRLNDELYNERFLQ